MPWIETYSVFRDVAIFILLCSYSELVHVRRPIWGKGDNTIILPFRYLLANLCLLSLSKRTM